MCINASGKHAAVASSGLFSLFIWSSFDGEGDEYYRQDDENTTCIPRAHSPPAGRRERQRTRVRGPSQATRKGCSERTRRRGKRESRRDRTERPSRRRPHTSPKIRSTSRDERTKQVGETVVGKMFATAIGFCSCPHGDVSGREAPDKLRWFCFAVHIHSCFQGAWVVLVADKGDNHASSLLPGCALPDLNVHLDGVARSCQLG